MTDILTTNAPTARIRLNRPKPRSTRSPNPMCEAITAALLGWRGDPDVQLILLDHADGRGFCAGGDIRMLAESGAGDGQAARDFFRAEYRMNHLLFTYAKPIVAVMDGITMGGGVGIALPATHRIATENTRLAMPETGIGLFPDVGGGWYLSRLPGQVGKFLALTGARLDGAECVALGLATHFVPAERLEAVKAEIIETPFKIDATLTHHSIKPPSGRILANREAIDRLFVADTLEGVIADLEADGGEWATKELATLRTKSPQSCKVALRQLREGREAHRLRRRNADGIRHCRPHRAAPRLHRGSARSHHRQRQRAPLGPCHAGWRHRRPHRHHFRASARRSGVDADQLTGPFMPDTLLIEHREAVTLVTLNRPKALNALNSQVLDELNEAMANLDRDPDQRCAVLTGSDKAFAAGADIKEMSEQGFASMYSHDFFAGWDRFTATRKPVIAAVAGFALGGGCELAMMCDLILAADTAKFGQPEIKLGGDARHGRLAASHPRRRQGQGDGDVPDRPDDGGRRSGAIRSGRARRSCRRFARRGDDDGHCRRRHAAARGAGREGAGERRL